MIDWGLGWIQMNSASSDHLPPRSHSGVPVRDQPELTEGLASAGGWDYLPAGGETATPGPLTIEQWGWLFVGVGLALRVVRFLLPFPLWCDEYQIADNFLDRDFAGLASPLRNNQVAPLGFLWAELASVRGLGFHEWSLRLVPFLCGVGSLLLMRHVSRRLLPGAAQVFAIAVLAVAYYPIRLGSEVKPYAGDLLVSLGILACLTEWHRERASPRWLWILAALIIPGLLLSFPAVFVGGAAASPSPRWWGMTGGPAPLGGAVPCRR